MFSVKSLLMSAAVGLTAIGLAAGSASAADVTLKLGHLANEANLWHKTSIKFAEEVAARTDGRIEVQIFPNESLGKEIDLINGMQLGTVDFAITGESLQNWAPKAALLAVPYAYKSLDHMTEVANSEIGKAIEAQIIERARVRPLAIMVRGPRNLTTNRPIKSPDDLNGLKMRVPNVPLFVDVWKSLGAQPTPMAFSEVFTSLQNGTIDAQENPLALIKSASFNEVQKYVNKTEHVNSWIYIAMSELTYSDLSAADQEAIVAAGKFAEKWYRSNFDAMQSELEAELKEKGMTFVEVDKAAFSKKAKTAVLANVSEEIRPIVEALFSK
ncbi:TRAP transporter substrate-binding protein [Pseudovibrio sp. Tun.PSC04-5.I4]|uniref:TRAP transporter substrate-binding protein n=1 Tax=Pseudovibrio sp. Tun.PSC04-5.I4 TaxID=1798213 RepID=UPI00087EA212|nr:TRAP transporter substrate-binding protein [Pseudovibrio sp. Tun.PSC04-5.I4]SDQ21630.1 tripartite ATP-independent transporter solute receptor, DctP family [Pseudovibrio sp. Tun.PSC04-5.I4]